MSVPTQDADPKPTPNPPSHPKPSKHSQKVFKQYAKSTKRKMKGTSLLSSAASASIPLEDFTAFTTHLTSSTRIMALLGAGLSASSGIPTFRGAGGLWRKYEATDLATPDAFAADPALVWQFYAWRRHHAARARPNRAHAALARLGADMGEKFLAVTQNIDGLSERAGHPEESLVRIHGSLWEVRCVGVDLGSLDGGCGYRAENRDDPIVPALAMPEGADLSDAEFPLKEVDVEDLPRCPECGGLLRPGVVWFWESLPQENVKRIHDWLDGGKIDLMIVVGTSAVVMPAAAYIYTTKKQGARVAVFVIEPEEEWEKGEVSALDKDDWFIQGDAAVLLPEMLKGKIGIIRGPEAQDLKKHVVEQAI